MPTTPWFNTFHEERVEAARPIQRYADDDLELDDFHLKKPVKSVPAASYGARVSDPATSHAATPTSSAAANVQNAILQAAMVYGPGTEEEFADRCAIPRPSISPQFAPMIRRGLLVNVMDPATGKPLKRKNESGKWAMVRGLPNNSI
jgi:hypothetical protein